MLLPQVEGICAASSTAMTMGSKPLRRSTTSQESMAHRLT